MNRVGVIQAILDKLSAKTYLEIGVRAGETFLPLKARKKMAVDPALVISARRKFDWIRWNICNIFSEYYLMTSDAFFEEYGPKLERRSLNVVFVDGLHTFEQSLRDVENALRYLNDDGVIVLDDCNPKSEAAANPVRTQVTWNGDVWKTIAYLRSARPDLDVFTLDCVFGLGIVTKRPAQSSLNLDPERIGSWSYNDFDGDRATILNLKPIDHLHYFLHSF
jgi:hypothetical protein